jgi:hypothetical protein
LKWFLDTEFIEDGRTIDLISIALVPERGDSIYYVSSEFDDEKANDFVKEHVLSKLHDEPKVPRTFIREMVSARIFAVDKEPEFWGYFADYDWVVFCQLWGPMISLPKGFPTYCRDLKQLLDQHQLKGTELVKIDKSKLHHALYDARYEKSVFEELTKRLQSIPV